MLNPYGVIIIFFPFETGQIVRLRLIIDVSFADKLAANARIFICLSWQNWFFSFLFMYSWLILFSIYGIILPKPPDNFCQFLKLQ